jgi:hypothetical protein
LINLKRKTKNQSQQWKIDRLAKIKLSQTTKPANTTSGASEKKPAITRKPIIITKMKLKNSIFSF